MAAQDAEKMRLLDEPVSMANEMAALLTVVAALRYLPPDLHVKAEALSRRWAARYDRAVSG